jgi:ureidoacrylate peracid hydrolase
MTDNPVAKNSAAENIAAATRRAHVPMLGSLVEKVDPRHTALLVIDMQNDFCADDGFVARAGRDVSAAQALAARLPTLIGTARDGGVRVVFVRSLYSTPLNNFLSDVWLEQAARKQGGGYTRAPVCGEGPGGGDYYGDLRPSPGDIVVTKHRYNAFHGTDLEMILRANGIRTVVVTGVTTNVCVESTARDSFMRDYYTVIVGDGTAAYTSEEHQTALKTFDRYFGEVASIDGLVGLWALRNI